MDGIGMVGILLLDNRGLGMADFMLGAGVPVLNR